ncbi:MAG: MotA/TolQ/ExbB proton channel family protein [Phycisphaeraceae bacterium]
MNIEVPQQLESLWKQAVELWLAGGWAMIAIAAVAVLMFSLGINIYLRLAGKGFGFVSETKWRRWLDHPEQRRGPIGRLLDRVTEGESVKQTEVLFEEVQATEVKPFERDLLVMKVCVAAAPLLGLLGTVTGMVATFDALTQGSGGDETQGMVASGISEALITTETGLVIALAGLFFQYQLVRKHQRYKAFIAQIHTVCTQRVYHAKHQ